MQDKDAKGAAGPHLRSPFYIQMGFLALGVSVTGFFLTYFRPMSAGTFNAPAIVHLHGLAAFGWIVIFLTQPLLIRFNKFPVHRIVGIAGLFIATIVMVGAIGTGLYAVERDLAAGLGDFAIAPIIGTVTGMLIFFGLVCAGVLYRRRPEVHKRLMLLATIAVLWPAWFRLRHIFPAIPFPEISLAVVAADSLILVAMLRDKLAEGRVHPVYLLVGSAIILEHVLEVVLFGTPGWIAAAKLLYAAGGAG